MTVCVENWKEWTKKKKTKQKTPTTPGTSSKSTGYKVNTQKSAAFLITSNDRVQHPISEKLRCKPSKTGTGSARGKSHKPDEGNQRTKYMEGYTVSVEKEDSVLSGRQLPNFI